MNVEYVMDCHTDMVDDQEKVVAKKGEEYPVRGLTYFDDYLVEYIIVLENGELAKWCREEGNYEKWFTLREIVI